MLIKSKAYYANKRRPFHSSSFQMHDVLAYMNRTQPPLSQFLCSVFAIPCVPVVGQSACIVEKMNCSGTRQNNSSCSMKLLQNLSSSCFDNDQTVLSLNHQVPTSKNKKHKKHENEKGFISDLPHCAILEAHHPRCLPLSSQKPP